MPAISRHQRLFDGLAIGASAVCLVHCLVLPALLVLLPTLGAWLAFPESFHVGALAFAVPTSAFALAGGYRRHRRARPVLIALLGLALLALGALAAPDEVVETVLTVPGAIALAIGHALNWRLARHA
ncbi:MerC domain-containing protein [Pelagerythrobacter marensis]|uniref:MerC domain-containing protein n=1 Tax=Pelagerythrobacter marensis TaxID=543877 RepID=A0ABZ2D5H7_9SPHN